MGIMSSDSNIAASYLRDIRPNASLFSLIKYRSGGHLLRVETGRWARPKPSREQRIVRCSMQAVEDEQQFLVDCPFVSINRDQASKPAGVVCRAVESSALRSGPGWIIQPPAKCC